MDRDERAGAEALVNVEGTVGVDVNTAVEGASTGAVPPDGQHAADGEQGGIDGEALADVVEDCVIGKIDVASMVNGGASARHHIADALGRIALTPSAVVVARRDSFDGETRDVELVARRDFAYFRKTEVCDNVFAPARHNDVRVSIQGAQAPAIEMIDVRMGDQYGIDAPGFARPPRQKRVKYDAGRVKRGNGGGMAQPSD